MIAISSGPGSEREGAPAARFDDLTEGGRCLEFRQPERCLDARTPEQLRELISELEQAQLDGKWAAGYIAYEAASALRPELKTRPPRAGEPLSELPLAWFAIFDSAREVASLEPEGAAEPGYLLSAWRPEIDEAGHRRGVEQVRSLIEAGEFYQCNLTLRLLSRFQGDPFALYRDLALAQRGAYNGFLDTGRFCIASASPELFFEWSKERITTRPMKGTRRRGRWPAEDRERAVELGASAKDRAENVMIVDLLRNDLGRLARAGSVGVRELFSVERFETVWQMTSTVDGELRPGLGMSQVLEALFPSGSVTGAPKARAMAAIADLERSSRGVYCGAVGFLAPVDHVPRARFSVAIRTLVLDRESGWAVYGSGGGITWDSEPAREHSELLAKAAILESRPQGFQLLETMGFWPGEGIRNLELHLDRLRSSADYFGFRIRLEQVRERLRAELVQTREPARVRLLLGPGGELDLELGVMPTPPGDLVALALDDLPVDQDEIWLYHKTTRRRTYRERARRHPGADDVILVNRRGELTEATVANLAICLGGSWYTPPLDSGCLPGVERRRLLEGGRLRERVLRPADLEGAEGLALLSSLRSWRPAKLLAAPTSGAAGGRPRSAEARARS